MKMLLQLFFRRCSWAEEMEAATPSRRGKAPRFERMMEELEEKLLQLRQDASILKRQLHAESKDRCLMPSWAKKILMWYPVFGVCKTWIFDRILFNVNVYIYIRRVTTLAHIYTYII